MTTRLPSSSGSPHAALFVPAFALALAVTFSAPLGAQTAPSGSGIAVTGETIALPEFQVSAIHDVGYRAGNSVSATRIDTPIKDLPFSVSAFTDQFMAALFLPHTDLTQFPSVQKVLEKRETTEETG